jgi:ferredoxin
MNSEMLMHVLAHHHADIPMESACRGQLACAGGRAVVAQRMP